MIRGRNGGRVVLRDNYLGGLRRRLGAAAIAGRGGAVDDGLRAARGNWLNKEHAAQIHRQLVVIPAAVVRVRFLLRTLVLGDGGRRRLTACLLLGGDLDIGGLFRRYGRNRIRNRLCHFRDYMRRRNSNLLLKVGRTLGGSDRRFHNLRRAVGIGDHKVFHHHQDLLWVFFDLLDDFLRDFIAIR